VVEVAKAIQASALFMITEGGGVFRDPGDPETRIPAIRAGDVDEMIRHNIIQGGMIPKVEESVNVLHQGVDVVAIVDAYHPGAFSSVISGDLRFGTRISLS
jgi:acetylglutamate kinase